MTDRVLALAGLVVAVAVVGAAPAVAQTATATLDEERLPLSSADQQVISGETSLEPGTELEVGVYSEEPEHPMVTRRTAYVTENGTFAAVVDMRPLPAGSDYEILVDADGRTLVERIGTVAACSGNCTDSVPEMPDEPASAQPDADVSVEQGGVVTLPVETGANGTAEFVFGNETVNYRLNATLTDGNDDGEVRVRFNTGTAGTKGETLSAADDADSVSVTHETPLKATIDAFAYHYRVFRDGDDPDVVRTLRIEANESADRRFEDDEIIETPEPEPTTPRFEDHIYLTKANWTARIVVQMANASVVTVTIGGPETGYQINATVRDGNGDDRVTLVFDAHAAGLSGETLTAGDDADSVTVVPGSEVTRETRIDPDYYHLYIYRGTDVSGHPLPNGTLVVTDPAVERRGQQTPTGTPTATAAVTGTAGGGPAGAGALALGGVVGIAGVTLLVRSVRS